MCKPKIPKMPAIPPPRSQARGPARSGAAAMAGQRVTAGYSNRSQVPAFASPVMTAKMGGEPVVLGG